MVEIPLFEFAAEMAAYKEASSSTFFIAPVLAIATAVNADINDRPRIEYFITGSTDIDVAVKSSRQ